jgi:predicted DNA-binding transcriptional regulator AlpA
LHTVQTGAVRPVYLRAKDIFAPNGILPISRSTFYNWCSSGRLPPGRRLSSGVTVWTLDDILAFASGEGER